MYKRTQIICKNIHLNIKPPLKYIQCEITCIYKEFPCTSTGKFTK